MSEAVHRRPRHGVAERGAAGVAGGLSSAQVRRERDGKRERKKERKEKKGKRRKEKGKINGEKVKKNGKKEKGKRKRGKRVRARAGGDRGPGRPRAASVTRA